MRQPYKHYVAPTRKNTPLDQKLRDVFSHVIQPGMYVTEMKDQSMSPFIPKGALLLMEEDQAIFPIVEVQWKRKRYIRQCVSLEKYDHWEFRPRNTEFPSFTSTPLNIKDTQIIGSLYCVLYFGKQNSKTEVIEKLKKAGDLRNLLKISEFNKHTRVGKIDCD